MAEQRLDSSVVVLFKRFYLFLERGERGRKRRGETLMWESYINRLPLSRPLLGTWPVTQACTLTGNQTGDSLVCRLVLNPLSHTSQSGFISFKGDSQQSRSESRGFCWSHVAQRGSFFPGSSWGPSSAWLLQEHGLGRGV